MKQPLLSPSPAALRHTPLRLASTLLLVLCLFAGGLAAQPAVTPLEPGKILHVRLTEYGFSTSKSDALKTRSWGASPGLELVYEKVGDAGRATRYLVGWQYSYYRNGTTSDTEEEASYRRVESSFRVGIGKSQAAHYKRLVLRGGVDAYLQASAGHRIKEDYYSAAGNLIQDGHVSGAPTFRVAARPFLGLGFQVSERMALGIEYGMDMGVEATIGNRRSRYRFPTGEFDRTDKQADFGLFANTTGFLPFIHLSYRF